MMTQTTLLNGDSLDRVQSLLDQYVADNKIAGAVAVIARAETEAEAAGDNAQIVTAGVQDLETNVAMGMDTIFRVYSLTKPVTSVATLMLVERGLLSLDDAVADYIPAFADVQVLVRETDGKPVVEPPEMPPTVRDLLTHTSGIGGTHMVQGAPLASLYRAARLDDRRQTLEEQAGKLASIPLLFQPGQQWRYGISTDVLGRVIEVACGQPFDQFLEDNIFTPLRMHDTGFHVDSTQAHRLATVYGTDGQGRLRPMSGLNANEFGTPPALKSGSSGLVSTPRDYLNFAQMLLGKGVWRGTRLLNPETVETFSTNHLPGRLLPYRLPWAHAGRFTAGAGFGLGVRVLLDVEQSGLPGSVGEYGWAGAANTFLWIDPVRELVLLLFTQAFPFLHTDLDQAFKRIVYESLET